MRTLTIDIQDDFVEDFLAIVAHYKDNIHIRKDENLVLDLYFYERKKQLQQDLKDIKSGKIKTLSQEQYDNQMNTFFDKLKSKYAN